MEPRRGRPPGRELSELELRHLRLLRGVQTHAQEYERTYDEQLEDFALELQEAGCSVRGIADAAGVAPTTVQRWTKHAKQRRES